MLLTFYILGTVSVLSALGVLVCRSPVYSAMSLVCSFFCLGGIYILMNVEFVAVIQILVYAGAILVLFLFVIMLLNIVPTGESVRFNLPVLIAFGIAVGLFAQISGLFLGDIQFGPKDVYTAEAISEEGSIGLIGRLLYGEFVLPFEAISILLLVAVIGAVIIGKRRLN
ncbi:MAG: NADH-quinone oxidoreductase subunit J [SAR324 cluster bacterium]|nr:NADH-quinone oxidoreductase subunit J [SAR324 cluster bacterium]